MNVRLMGKYSQFEGHNRNKCLLSMTNVFIFAGKSKKLEVCLKSKE